VTATVKGEVEAIMQLSMEVTEMLRAKQLKALAVMDSEPLDVEGYGAIPPITNWLPDFPSVGNRFGFFLPKDIPADAKEAITGAFKTAAASDAIKKFAVDRGSKVVTLYGEEAEKGQGLQGLLAPLRIRGHQELPGQVRDRKTVISSAPQEGGFAPPSFFTSFPAEVCPWKRKISRPA